MHNIGDFLSSEVTAYAVHMPPFLFFLKRLIIHMYCL